MSEDIILAYKCERPIESATKVIALYWPECIVDDVSEEDRILGIYERFVYKTKEDKELWSIEGGQDWNLETLIHFLWIPEDKEFTVVHDSNPLIVEGLAKWIDNPPSGDRNTPREEELPCVHCHKIFKRKDLIFDNDSWAWSDGKGMKHVWICEACQKDMIMDE